MSERSGTLAHDPFDGRQPTNHERMSGEPWDASYWDGIASSGPGVLGLDVAETAVALANEKAEARGVDAEFVVADAFALGSLSRVFDTVLDSGMFHTCDAAEQCTYVASLASVTRAGATLYVLCFRDSGPESERGPHPVSRD